MENELSTLLDKHALILAEGAVCERLRRRPEITLHPTLFNTPLIYDHRAAELMAGIYQEYRDIARRAACPILHGAPTWRLDQERIRAARVPETINEDAVAWMLALRERWSDARSPVLVAGLMGPKNDCYSPEDALSEAEAERFHRWQAERLAAAGIDFFLAQTMPEVNEARGLARAMAATGLPYIISFVIQRSGQVLDGHSLVEAIDKLDQTLARPPNAYMVNCAYPSFVPAESPSLFERLRGIQANASSRDVRELDGAAELQRDALSDWTAAMLALRERGLKILGGCCGTDDRYLKSLAPPRG